MARAGRKRKLNVIRDDSGKSRGEVFDPEFFFKQPHRREIVAVMQGWGKDRDGKDRHTRPENVTRAGFPLGRLRINGLITQDQLRAGNGYAAVVHAYARVNGIQMGSPRSGSMSDCIASGFYSWEGDKIEVDPAEATKRVARVNERFNQCHEALAELGKLHHRGNRIHVIMREVCIQEIAERALWADEHKLGDLRLGLNAVQKVLLEKARV